MNHYLYLDVRVIRNGKVGTVIDVDDFDGKVFIEFPDGTRSWEFESDIIEVGV